MNLRHLLVLWVFLASLHAGAQTPTHSGLVYATVGGVPLRLDLFLPSSSPPFPLVIWVHGGGWCSGARAPLASYALPLVADGVAVASVDYRLTSTTPNCANSAGVVWPAPMHDLKGAVRWIRAQSASYGIDPTRIAVWGQSAGAHLASILALSAGASELEGTVGGNQSFSSAVAGVVAFFPPVDLLWLGPDFAESPPARPDLVAAADGPGTPHAILVGFGAAGEGMGVLRARLGDPTPPWPERIALAQSATVTTWVDPSDPPVYLAHGTADVTVPLNQSRRLRAALLAAGNAVNYREVPGFGHTALDSATEAAARAWLRNLLTDDPISRDGFEASTRGHP